MIDGLKPYPAYKDSGVPWLGEVPAHWEVLPGRACFRLISRPNRGLVERNVLSLSYGRIVVKAEEKLHGLVPASFDSYQIIEPGDIICRPTDLQNDQTSLRFGQAPCRGIITSAYFCLQTRKDLNSRFGYFLLHAYDVNKVFYGLGSGLRQNLDWEDFKYLPSLLPPLPEQTAIVRFLDYMDRKIRRVIRARQRRVVLLEEYKKALIHRAVTGQMDVRTGKPYPAYKDSGVPWLGQVPAHWELRRLKSAVAHINDQTNAKNPDDLYIALEHVESWTGRLRAPSGGVQFDSQVKRFRAGDVLFGKLRPYLAKVVQPERDGVCVGEFFVLRSSHAVTPRYLEVALRSASAIDYINSSTYGAKMPRAQWAFVGNMPFPFPPLPEQTAIVEYLDAQTAKIDAAIAATRREMELLREYREKLTTDVVTGKVDVRTVKCEVGSVNDATEEDEVGWEKAHHEDGEAEDGLEGEMREADMDE